MEKNRNIILAFYAVLSVIVIMSSTPNVSLVTYGRLANYGFTISMIVLIVAYIARAKFPRNDSFEENHTTFIIRTLWIYTSIAALGMIGAAIEVAQQGNLDAIQPIADSVASGIQPTEAEMRASVLQYLTDNDSLLRMQFHIWLCPAQLYLIWRILRGGSRAFKSYRIANPKNWF